MIVKVRMDKTLCTFAVEWRWHEGKAVFEGLCFIRRSTWRDVVEADSSWKGTVTPMLLISGKEIAENCENPFDIWEAFLGKMLVRECRARQNVFTW